MPRLFTCLIASCFALVAVRPASAFNELGHCVIAKVAYDSLTDSQRDTVHNILKSHPHYAEYLAANLPVDVSPREWSFFRAATWSDWVRSNHTTDYHKSEWHYINYPYRLGQPDTSALPPPLPQDRHILERIPRAISTIKNGATNDLDLSNGLTIEQRRAVALCWLFHLIGDLHQPLHVVALIDDARFPASSHGDRGGNELAVVANGSRPLRLHSYWDGVLGRDASYSNVAAIVKSFTTDPPLSTNELAERRAVHDIQSWALESYQLAAQHVYLDGQLPIAPWKPTYNDPAAPAAPEVPILKASVKANDRKISRQRLLLAGHRLADQLKQLFP
jgi:hypothetical protein